MKFRPHWLRAAAFLAVTGCLYAGMGAAAWADEFQILVNGNPLRFERVSIEDSWGQPWRTMQTDDNGHLVVPYRGTVETYQLKYDGTENGRSRTFIGILRVDGQREPKVVRLR
jgi:hypothetical protein